VFLLMGAAEGARRKVAEAFDASINSEAIAQEREETFTQQRRSG
jgi:hypothetical protein